MTEYRVKNAARLEAMRQTRLELAARKLTGSRKAEYVRYRRKLEADRVVLQETGMSPYERAVKRIERVTGVPASKWEYKLSHPYVRLANRVARDLCNIDQPMQRVAA